MNRGRTKARSIRKQVLLEGGVCCRYCGKRLKPSAYGETGVLRPDDFVFDHVVARARGGSDDAENLAPACVRCNSSKAARSLEDWRWHWKVKTSALAGVIGGMQAKRLVELGVALPINHEFKFHFEREAVNA